MKKKFIDSRDLPKGEKVYLRKSGKAWKTIYPWVNEDGSFNFYNFATQGKGYKSLIFTLIGMLILGGLFYLGVNELISGYKDIAENPCNYCASAPNSNWIPEFNIDFSDIKKEGGDIG